MFEKTIALFDFSPDLKEVMPSNDSASNALSRVLPSSPNDVNGYGYGFKAFARVNSLYSGGFVGADGSLAIRAFVREDAEHDILEQDPYDDSLP